MSGKTPDRDLIELGGSTVYENKGVGAVITINNAKYKIINTKYKADAGLDAMTVANIDTGEISIVYQGTQGVDDMLTDASLPGNNIDAQLKAANDYYNEMNDYYKKTPIVLTNSKGEKVKFPQAGVINVAGNSLGGGLANHVAIQNQGVYSVAFDPAILPYAPDSGKAKYITSYMSQYDPLTLGELGIGYDARIPGKQVTMYSGLPWFAALTDNHTGYNDDGEYEIGKPGDVGYGKIKIGADDYLAVSPWGNVLAKNYAGSGVRIKIDPATLGQLETSLTANTLVQLKDAQKYLDNSVDIVNHEGGKLDDRTGTLKSQFDVALKDTAFGKVFLSAGAYEQLRNEFEKEYPIFTTAIDVMQRIRTTPVISDILDFILSNSFTVIDALLKLPLLLSDIVLKAEDIIDHIGEIKNKAIPKLFVNIDNHFFDGIVDELTKHYSIIDSNKDKMTVQMINFRDQVKAVKDVMQLADQNASKGIYDEVNSGPSTVKIFLEDSQYLKAGMAVRQKQIDDNFRAFSSSLSGSMKPLLRNLGSVINQAKLAIDDILRNVRVIVSAVSMVDIPIVTFDDDLRNTLRSLERTLTGLKQSIEGAHQAVTDLESNFETVLTNFKPYIDTALFEGTKYQNVILYNQASLNILEIARLVFIDIKYQMTGSNNSTAVESLNIISNDVLLNLEKLIGQVKLGTIQ
ncbi:hypothetical protein HCA00_15110 [Listeria booriae]|uniref:SA1320 family protein n=1 Tax=Listeria booriae TaxID=1552123 RepID=UPI0016258901|nr:hypothetical protein [Listeria booriae]MBC2676337.1 hypothetical protein [Listeria booriae]MBC6130143.1 hypothetical protein [Listeria booriae]